MKKIFPLIVKPIIWTLVITLTHNPIAISYMMTGVLFFKPFPAFADAFLDKAAEGQSFGTGIMNDYNIPSVNATTGQMTLNNGLVAGQTVQQNELFQEITPGSMDAARASYGDSSALGAKVNTDITALTTGTSQHASAYQTLMSSNSSMADISNDPMWKTSDDIYSQKSPLINDLFSGCVKKTDFSEKDCAIHIADLKSCKKTLKEQPCEVTRVITAVTSIMFTGGTGNITSCGPDCYYLNVGVIGDNYWDVGKSGCNELTWDAIFTVIAPNSIVSVTLDDLEYDDQTLVYVNGTHIYTGRSGWGGACDLKNNWSDHPNLDVTQYFKTAGQVKIHQTTRVGGKGEGYLRFKVKTTDVKQSFVDNPAGCKDRLFAAWPPKGVAPTFVSSGSLNDQASNEWWQCTDAALTRVFGPVTVTSKNFGAFLGPILPGAPATPPAPICYKAITRMPGHVTLPCFNDADGYPVCPSFNFDTNAHTSCDTIIANPNCAYIGEKCADGAVSPVTGVCQEFIVTYDCGTNTPATCDQVNAGEKTICDGSLRCMGGECVDQAVESNADFIRAATALQTLNKAQQELKCDAGKGECTLFDGTAMECQMADLSILGKVDCCNMPIQGSWIDYMWLAQNSWQAADMSVELYSTLQNGVLLTDAVGAWTMVSTGTVLQAPVAAIVDTWSAVTQPFTSMYDSVATLAGETIQDIGGDVASNLVADIGVEAIKQQMTQWLGEWIADTFGQAAAETLLATTTSTVGSVTTSTYSMAGSMLSSIVSVVGIIYAIYQIAKMVVQLVFACTEEEVKLNMLKSQKLCTSTGQIGDYCSSKSAFGCVARKEAYCCFSSPFARIFQEQARPQLGKTFGDPKAPICDGLKISEVQTLDFNKMHFDEWVNMLKGSNQIPANGASANIMYDKALVTKGTLGPGAHTNSQDRLTGQTEGSNIDAIRQHLLNNM
jgi:conjugal transfer mating pair stabilization protein TraN